MSPSQLRIAIVGGGPGGLTLGVLLHKHNIPFTIFELRERPTEQDFSQPSGSLDLHEESGLAALKACGICDEAMSLTGDCTEEQKVADRYGNIIYQDDGGERNRPEIYRHDLMKLLLSHVPPNSIRWSHKLASAKRLAPSEVELDFANNGKHTFNLVIGADGAWSRVRPLLTDRKPHYANMHNITLNIRHITTRYPQLAALVGGGTFTSLADKHGVFSQRATQNSARMYIMLSTEDANFATSSGLAGKTPSQAKDLLVGEKAMLSQWGETTGSRCMRRRNSP
jgi:2-polyprenyl-6-methoxyphenol hydroxylase-like FAD-dependent oxidoreductase